MTLHPILLNFLMRKILFSYLSVCFHAAQILSVFPQNPPQFKWGHKYFITSVHSTKVGLILFSCKNKIEDTVFKGSRPIIETDFFPILIWIGLAQVPYKNAKNFFDLELRIHGDICSQKSAPSFHFCGAQRLLVLYVYGRSLLLDYL